MTPENIIAVMLGLPIMIILWMGVFMIIKSIWEDW